MKLNSKWRLEELVPKDVFKEHGEKAIKVLDSRLPTLLLQVNFITQSRLIVNTWHYEKDGFQERGFRTPESTVGTSLSQHRHGRAADITSLDINIQSCYEAIIEEANYLRNFGLSRIYLDEDKNFIHMDMAWTRQNELIILS